MKRIILTAGVLLSILTVQAQTSVTPYNITNNGKDYGVYYALPTTEIEIEVEATKVNYQPGEFCKYAERYLRLENVSPTAEEHWELSSVKAIGVGVPNKEHSYFVKLKDKTLAPLMELTADGIIRSINMPLSKEVVSASTLTPAQSIVNPRDFMTEEILMAGSTAKMAELVSQEIYNIRESKNLLVRGQAENMPKDGVSLKLMLDNLAIQEEALTKMFAGVTTRESRTFKLRILPAEGLKDKMLFRFSQKLGVLDINNLAGEPVFFTLENLQTVSVPVNDGKKKSEKVEGVAYNVPGKASISIRKEDQELFKGEVAVTQFGNIEYLAPNLFEKKSTIKVLFDPITGGLIKVEREEAQ